MNVIPEQQLETGVFPWQSSVWHQLVSQYTNQHLPHAILLSSRPHSGLHAFSQALAARLICTSPAVESACGECRNCKLLKGGGHPDVFVLEPEEDSKVIKIDQIRNFVHKISLTPGIANCKVALVRPAEAMNVAAANALLKTLEEPSGDAFIILASTEVARLLPTIRSRCQQYTFAAADVSCVKQWLMTQEFPEDKIDAAMLAARGLPLLAAEYLQGDLLEIRRSVGIGYLKTARGQADPVTVAASWVALGQPLVWLWLSQWMGDITRASMSSQPCPDPVSEAVRKVRPNFPVKSLLHLQSLAMQGWKSRESSLRQDLLFEQWLLQWAQQ